MAADVTFVGLPASDANWDVIRRGFMGGAECEGFDREFYARADLAHCEVGAVSWLKAWFLEDDGYLPSPTVAVFNMWERPEILTVGRAKATMAALNLPDRSVYRTHRRSARRRRLPVKQWLAAHEGWIVWAESW